MWIPLQNMTMNLLEVLKRKVIKYFWALYRLIVRMFGNRYKNKHSPEEKKEESGGIIRKALYRLIIRMFRNRHENRHSHKEKWDDDGDTIRNAYREVLEEVGEIQFADINTINEMDMNKVVVDYATRHTYYVKPDKIVVRLNRKETRVMAATITHMEKSDIMELVRDGDKTGVVTQISFGSHKLKATCAHVISGMSINQMSEFAKINPMVYITASKTIVTSNKPVGKYEKCHLIVPSVEGDRNYWIQTKPLLIMNANMMVKSRYRSVTVGLILQFVCEPKMIFSGTVAKTDDMCFIISSMFQESGSEVVTLIGWATISHDMVSEVLV